MPSCRIGTTTIVTVAFIWVSCAPTSTRAEAEEWLAQFKESGLAKLSELEMKYRQLSGTMIEESSNHAKHDVIKEFVFCDDRLRLITRRESEGDPAVQKRGFQEVYGKNPRYTFALKQMSRDSPFLLQYRGRPEARTEMAMAIELGNSINAPWAVFDKSLANWVKTKDFEIKRTELLNEDKRHLVRLGVFYDTGRDMRPFETMPAFSGDLFLAPDKYWAIERLSLVIHRRVGGRIVADVPLLRSVEWGPDVDGFPMPRSIVNSTGTGPGAFKETFTVQKLISRKAEEREFTLSAFGLADMEDGAFLERTYLWLYLLAIGLFIGIGSIIMAWQAWRKRKAAAA